MKPLLLMAIAIMFASCGQKETKTTSVKRKNTGIISIPSNDSTTNVALGNRVVHPKEDSIAIHTKVIVVDYSKQLFQVITECGHYYRGHLGVVIFADGTTQKEKDNYSYGFLDTFKVIKSKPLPLSEVDDSRIEQYRECLNVISAHNFQMHKKDILDSISQRRSVNPVYKSNDTAWFGTAYASKF